MDLEPFKGLLLGLFFMTVGMSLDLPAILAQLGWVMAALAGLIALKLLIAYLACRLFAGGTRSRSRRRCCWRPPGSLRS